MLASNDNQQLTAYVSTAMGVGGSFTAQGDLTRASKVYEGFLLVLDKIAGADNDESARLVFALGELHEQAKQFDQAEGYFTRLHATAVRQKGAMHPAVAQRLASIAHLNLTCGRLSEAESLYQQALSAAKASENLHAAFDIYNGLSSLYHATERWHEAEKEDRRIVAVCRDVFEQDHPRTLYADAELVVTLASLGQQAVALNGVAHVWSSLASGALSGWLRHDFIRKYGPVFYAVAKAEDFADQIEAAMADAASNSDENIDSFQADAIKVLMTWAGDYGSSAGWRSLAEQRDQYLDYLTKKFPGLAEQGLARQQAVAEANRDFLQVADGWILGIWRCHRDNEPWLDDVEQRRRFCRGALAGLTDGVQSLLSPT